MATREELKDWYAKLDELIAEYTSNEKVEPTLEQMHHLGITALTLYLDEKLGRGPGLTGFLLVTGRYSSALGDQRLKMPNPADDEED